MPTVPVSQNRVGIADVTNARLQAPDLRGTGLEVLGDGLQQVGGALGVYAKHQDDIHLNEATAAASKSAAQLRLDASIEAQRLRDNADPGGAGHVEQANQWWESNSQTVLDGVTDKRVRQQLEEQLAGSRATFLAQENAWADQRRLDKLGTDDADAASIATNRIASAPDLATAAAYRAEERTAAIERIAGYADVPDDARSAMLRKFEKGSAQATLDMGVRTDWKKTKELLDTGAFNDDLSAAEIKQGYSAIGVEQRRAEAQQEHAIALAKTQAKEQLSTLNARLEAGEEVPDKELQAAQSLASAIGDDSGSYKLGVARVQSGINRETQGWTPQQYATRINNLLAKGSKRTPDEDVTLKQLQKIAPSRTSDFNNDPGAWASLNGHPPPPVAFSDPASFAARIQWQRTISAQTGRPTPFLQPAEVADLKAQADASPRGKLSVVNTLAGIAGVDRNAAVRAVRQVMPDDDLAARVVLLNPSNRAAVFNGAEARKADKTLIDGNTSGSSGAMAQAKYRRDLAPALALLKPSDAEATYNVAANMYADWATKSGTHTFNDAQFGKFLHLSLGATIDEKGAFHGGVGYWHDTPVVLPHWASQQQFETTLSRINWKPDDPAAPVFANGKAMAPADIRKLTPVQRPDGRYEFHGENGVVATARNGTVWWLDISRTGRHIFK